MFAKPFPFGPLTNSAAVQAQVSEGEESDVDITDVMVTQAGKKEDFMSQNAIATRASQQQKGGPRVSDVTDLMIDLAALKEVSDVRKLPKKASQVYMTIQGIENSQ